jgi:hypothetical protein
VWKTRLFAEECLQEAAQILDDLNLNAGHCLVLRVQAYLCERLIDVEFEQFIQFVLDLYGEVLCHVTLHPLGLVGAPS